jgi:tyrosine-protein phosphatase SIW14
MSHRVTGETIEALLRSTVAVVVVLVALLEVGCASAPAGPAIATLAVPCDDCVRGVANFAKVSPALWRGSQPTAEGFRNLKEMGVRTVINVRHDHDDTGVLSGMDLGYVRIRTRAWNPKEADLVPFMRVMQNPDNWPVFIHCNKGKDRVGFYVAAYRIVIDGWSTDDALRELFRFKYNPIWFRIPIVLREIDVENLKAQVAAPLAVRSPLPDRAP